MKISLHLAKAFQWHQNEHYSFKGYFYVAHEYYEKENALVYLSKLKTISDLKLFIQNINGIFTIIKKDTNQLCIVSDVTRSFPVFYTYNDQQWHFSDDIFWIQKNIKNVQFDALSQVEFKASNHTHGSKTLIENVYQTQSSESLLFTKDEIIERSFYFSYSIAKESVSLYPELKKKAVEAFEASFQRLITSLGNKTAIVPLSSGYDSRMIALMFKKFNYKNVICYTYGKKDSFEIENSQKTALALGFEWHFIAYHTQLIADYLHSDEFREYAHFAGKFSSMPNLQEYFAVKYLKEHLLIPEDAVFIPGYAGDILGGSEYLITIPEKLDHDTIAKAILDKKMINYRLDAAEKEQMESEIYKNLSLFDRNYRQKLAATVFDDYNLKERIAKYIFNSASFYTYFGFEFRFPFWDRELLDFFKEVPLKFKEQKVLFDEVLIHEYFKKFNLCFETKMPTKPKFDASSKIKGAIKPFLPIFIKEKRLEKSDWNNYKLITAQMLLQMEQKGMQVERTYKDYNEIITQWYLFFSKNELD